MLFPEALASRTQDDALQCLASRDKPPERDQQLACQRGDHRLARAYTAVGSAGLVPLRQCALFLKPQEPPGELDHAAADPGVAGSGKALFPSLGAALVRRARQAGVARHALRSRIGRESTSWTSISAVSTPTPTTRARCRTMACGPLSGSCSNRFSSISLIWLMTNPRRAMSRCSSAKPFGGSGMPSGVCSVARRSAAPRLRGGRPAQGWFEIANAKPDQGALHSVHNARAFPDQALALPVRPLGVLFGYRRDARHAAMAPFSPQPPQEP